MAVMTDSQSIAANATVDNVLAGKLAEFLPEDSVLRLYATGSATGVQASLLVGGEALVDDQLISDANRFPIIEDDLVAEGAGFEGDRLILRLRNTTGAAIVARTRLNIEPA